MSQQQDPMSSFVCPLPPPSQCLHASVSHPVLRQWATEATLEPQHLLYPIFVTDDVGQRVAIPSLPGQARWSPDRLPELLDPLVRLGLKAVLLFGVLTDASKKDARGSFADSPDAPVAVALRLLKARYPGLLLCTDVCLCAYTDHGHCGLLAADDDEASSTVTIDNSASLPRLASMAVSHARAGAAVVAPSDMMDGRIAAIKAALQHAGAGLASRTAVMAYSAKLASCFYGPFRDAAGSGAKKGDRSGYQLPPGSRGLALRAVARDLAEGADSVMVKPGGPYLDVLKQAADMAAERGVPAAVYQVSGEYAAIVHAANAGGLSLREAVMESLLGFRRAGATIVITYFAEEALRAIKERREAEYAPVIVE